jgi:hypothetical protein
LSSLKPWQNLTPKRDGGEKVLERKKSRAPERSPTDERTAKANNQKDRTRGDGGIRGRIHGREIETAHLEDAEVEMTEM